MLPTKGFFKSTDCPFRDTECRRPYCHFRHRKTTHGEHKGNSGQKQPAPTYKPTPKSELEQIKNKQKRSTSSYVPTNVPLSEQPAYNPTPKSILASNALSEAVTKNIEVQPLEKPEESKLKETKEKTTESTSGHKSKRSKRSRSRERDKSKRHKKSTKHSKDDHRKHHSSRHHSRHSSKSKDKSKSKEMQKVTEKEENLENSTTMSVSDYEDNDLDEEIDSMIINDECLKIFNEYKPAESTATTVFQEPKPVEESLENVTCTVQAKKRIAYSNAANNVISKPNNLLRKPISNLGLTVHSRIRMAKEAQAKNEVENLMAELKNQPINTSKPTSNVLPVAKPKPKPINTRPSNNLIDDIINGRTTSTTHKTAKRIAPVTNVNSIQMAKAKIEEMKKTIEPVKTVAKTYAKGNKRVAHVPDTSLANIPDVLEATNSKIAVHVRTKYLCLMAEECTKLYVSLQEAYTRALNEEFRVYQRCSIFSTYRNAAMLAVNRLRKENQERQNAGLGPFDIGESAAGKTVLNSPLEGRKLYENIKDFILSAEELRLHGFPVESSTPGRAIIENSDQKNQQVQLHSNQRLCCRCHKVYNIDKSGFPVIKEECCYHPLRKRTIRGEQSYLCCKSTDATGCAMSSTHVSEVSADRELIGYQTTLESEDAEDPRNFVVYALDCEMCYTTKGLELTRVTVVDPQLRTVYETLVKPLNPIIDYNTRFSGITQELMDKTSTNILQVQANIMHLCSAKTILIGHSLESDMKALKIIHGTVIDTSILFPHKLGLPHKRALRTLASDYLKKIIQNDVSGHDSAEDALAAMELVLWKVKDNLKAKGVKY